jgi:hypothetical protein
MHANDRPFANDKPFANDIPFRCMLIISCIELGTQNTHTHIPTHYKECWCKIIQTGTHTLFVTIGPS